MTVTELNNEQMLHLKQRYLEEHLLETEDRTPSYNELANADNIVANRLIYDAYDATAFSPDDFS